MSYFQALHYIQAECTKLSKKLQSMHEDVIGQKGYFEGQTKVFHTKSTESTAKLESLQNYTQTGFENFNGFGNALVNQFKQIQSSVAALNDVCFPDTPQEGGQSGHARDFDEVAPWLI
jgi:hypothetical protein